jgi:cytochrome b561
MDEAVGGAHIRPHRSAGGVGIAMHQSYDAVAKTLHWLVAALVTAQFTLGWTMPPIGRNTLPVGLIFWHASIGMLLLAVVLIRLAWRFAHPVALLGGVPVWQNWIARVTHGLLYAALVVQLLLGWANASARAWKLDLFGAVPMPWILPAASPVGMKSGDIHNIFAWVVLGLIALHVAAALYHHFVLRDRVLRRMLPMAGD